MFTPKPISAGTIDDALAKAERYRLLNDPREAESISLDILSTAPDEQRAVVTLLLSITDQFKDDLLPNVQRAKAMLDRLDSEYSQYYYSGIITERWAKVIMADDSLCKDRRVHDGLKEAMTWYEKAESVRPPNNESSILRWNACARIVEERLVGMSGEHHLEDLGITPKS
jgi:hypothetical protein